MKKPIGIIIVLLLLFIAGCGGNNQTSDADSYDDDTMQVSAQVESPETVIDFTKSVVERITDGGTMSDVTYEYIKQHESLFPAKTPEDIQAAQTSVNYQITPKHLNKNLVPYENQLISVTGQVVSVEETETDYGTLSVIHILDDDYNSIICCYLDTTGDLLENDTATIIGVPAVAYSFDNIGGGTTNAIMVVGSYVTKVQY